MAKLTPIHATAEKAAQLLDMSLAEFDRLVKAGHLPRGREIAPQTIRWNVSDLQMICSGGAADGEGRINWK